jgi:hypothetical protein
MRPYSKNPHYWQYKGEPVLLIGGSVEDNLFQIPDLEEHLDLLASVGGNYVRCTMSSRDQGDAWPFERDMASGLYDLTQPGREYWARFERFLKLADERDIVAQFELWDRFDFSREPWQDNPYNPKNNINYTAEESGLMTEIATHPGLGENAFFRSAPALEDNQLLLRYQNPQVDTMLSYSLKYGGVLYCIDNETRESPEWGSYWASYVKSRAAEAGVEVQTTEMWDDRDLTAPQHSATYDHPETYTFVDVSQNNHQSAESHWSGLQAVRRRIVESGEVRPINSVKIYGASTGPYGSSRDGQERFWRNIMGGLASSRFHRPPSGLGLAEIAQAHLRSMRMLTAEIDIFGCEPRNDLIGTRSWNAAYCLANAGVDYAVFFTDGGNVVLDMGAAPGGPVSLRWLDIRGCRWTGEAATTEPASKDEIYKIAPRPLLKGDGPFLRLVTPTEEGYWAAVVKIQA